jgi:NTP pyrophosphatase (non-canonical NTP hydrolase)
MKRNRGYSKVVGRVVSLEHKTIDEWCKYIVDWRERKKFETCWENVPLKLMLVVTELSEAMEAYRKLNIATGIEVWGEPGVMENFEEELADVAIRLFDLCGSLGIDLEEAMKKKMKANEKRPIKHNKSC